MSISHMSSVMTLLGLDLPVSIGKGVIVLRDTYLLPKCASPILSGSSSGILSDIQSTIV